MNFVLLTFYLWILYLIIDMFPLLWQCCQALAAAVCSGDESPTCVVPRILFLDSYFSCEDKANWNWPRGVKIHVIGSLILQEVFRYHSVCNLFFFFFFTPPSFCLLSFFLFC